MATRKEDTVGDIVYTWTKGDIQVVAKHGFLEHAKNCDFLNPLKCLDGAQITASRLATLHKKINAPGSENDGFPPAWSRARKLEFITKAEYENEHRDLTTDKGKALEDYWNAKKLKWGKPDLETRSGDSFYLFGQYQLASNPEEEEEPLGLSSAESDFILRLSSDQSMVRLVIYNLLRDERIKAAGNAAYDVMTGEPVAETWIEYDDDLDEDIKEESQEALDAAIKYEIDEDEETLEDNYDLGDDDMMGDDDYPDWDDPDQYDQDDWEDNTDAKEEIEEANKTDRAEEKHESTYRAMRPIVIDENYDDIESPSQEQSVSTLFNDSKLLNAPTSSNEADQSKVLTHIQEPEHVDPTNMQLTDEEELEICGYMNNLGFAMAMDSMKDALDDVESPGTHHQEISGYRIDKKARYVQNGSQNTSLSAISTSIGGVKKKKKIHRGLGKRGATRKQKNAAEFGKVSQLGQVGHLEQSTMAGGDTMMGGVDEEEVL